MEDSFLQNIVCFFVCFSFQDTEFKEESFTNGTGG